MDIYEAYIPFPAFNSADVCAVEPAKLSECFLGHPVS